MRTTIVSDKFRLRCAFHYSIDWAFFCAPISIRLSADNLSITMRVLVSNHRTPTDVLPFLVPYGANGFIEMVRA